ncbi:glycerophosphodiester phosphodiesterase [Luteimonas sp. MC1828]|nr:glycerophosphodiester phosphodiesterase [Luteimonas sp. MC1828]
MAASPMPTTAGQTEVQPPAPLVIAHRGASAVLPEHTLAAYARAIEDGADYIEPDLVATRDGVLVARHEGEIGGTTDVAAHPAFADRRTTRRVDGREIEGWFVEDFTLAELRSLRARERLPQLRGTAHDGLYAVPTFDEIVALVARESAARGRELGLIPELKHSTHFSARGLPLEDRLLDALAAHPYTRSAAVVIQSFEVGNLRALRAKLGEGRANIRLLQLLGAADARPADIAAGGPTYADMATAAGLREVATYADVLGPQLGYVVPVGADGRLGKPTTLVADAHAAGLQVMPYTFRPENRFLPRSLWQGEDPRSRNEEGAVAHIRALLDAGIDGFFTDDVRVGRRAVD